VKAMYISRTQELSFFSSLFPLKKTTTIRLWSYSKYQ
jgi:hypothetical protein